MGLEMGLVSFNTLKKILQYRKYLSCYQGMSKESICEEIKMPRQKQIKQRNEMKHDTHCYTLYISILFICLS